MSKHRFDHMVDHSDDTKPDRRPDRLQRIEVITGVERRRKWRAEEKLAIVAESLVEGVVISEVARRHGISPQQLFGWRFQVRAGMTATAEDATPPFVPAIADDTAGRQIAPSPAVAGPVTGPVAGGDAGIEITLGSTLVRVRGVVDTKMLTAVLKALKVAP
jgi:transposase